jgi:DNA-directed RNA polymerase II subunit RPB2
MTIGHLVECLLAKTCAVRGCHGDGTPFQGTTVDGIAKELQKHGYPGYGKEKLFCGVTGRALDAMVFMGPTYYQRLKHMVQDKWHSRGSGGPVTTLTRQPLEGRSKDGGLRFGEVGVIIVTLSPEMFAPHSHHHRHHRRWRRMRPWRTARP